MGSTKITLASYLVISAGDMSGNLTSKVTVITNLDNIGVQYNWTGTPTGNFGIDVSLDNSNWNSLTLSPAPAATGSAGTYYVDLNQLSATYIRATYTFGSGTGSLNVYITGKSV